MKKVLALVLVVLLCFTFAACGGNAPASSAPASKPAESASQPASEPASSAPESSQPEAEPSTQPETPPASEAPAEPAGTARVAALKGPTAMGMVKMMSDDASAAAPKYDFSIHAAIDEITPLLVQGEVDIAAVPANLASVLYNNTKGQVQVLTVNTLGVLYLVESGDTVQSVEDLRGRTIYSSGKGATPEYALNYMLSQNGIDPASDVTIEWKSEHSECVAALASQENAIAMLPQPFVTTAQMKNENIRVCLDLNQEWEELSSQSGSSATLITGATVVRKAFAEENPQVIEAFLADYKASVEYANSDVDGAAALIGSFDIVPEPVAKKALPYCNITFIAGAELQEKLSGYLQTLFDQNPKAVGGTMPGDDFYYVK